PTQVIDALPEDRDKILDHRLGARFFTRRKIPLYVELADRFAKCGTRRIYTAFPAVTQRRGAGQHLAMKAEILIDKGMRQIGCRMFDGVKCQKVPPSI